MNTSRFNLKILLLPLVVIGAAMVVLLVLQSLQFRIASTNPRTSAVSSISPFIKINFSKSLNPASLNLQNDTSFMRSYSVKDKTITVNLKQLYVNKSYTIHLDSVESVDGKKLSNLDIRFTAKDIAFKDLPDDQQKAILANQDKLPKASSDPILKYLPYSTVSYTITSLVRQASDTNPSGLYVHADIFLSNAELSGDVQATINQYEQEITDYIRSKGLDPAKYSIEYSVVSNDTSND